MAFSEEEKSEPVSPALRVAPLGVRPRRRDSPAPLPTALAELRQPAASAPVPSVKSSAPTAPAANKAQLHSSQPPAFLSPGLKLVWPHLEPEVRAQLLSEEVQQEDRRHACDTTAAAEAAAAKAEHELHRAVFEDEHRPLDARAAVL